MFVCVHLAVHALVSQDKPVAAEIAAMERSRSRNLPRNRSKTCCPVTVDTDSAVAPAGQASSSSTGGCAPVVDLTASPSCSEAETNDQTVPCPSEGAPADLDSQCQVDITELFSPPRLLQHNRIGAFNLRPGRSFDLLEGCDLGTVEGRATVWRHLEVARPRVVITSAPCTMYSALMWMRNRRRMDTETYCRRRAAADELLTFSMQVCCHQHSCGRYFLHEHPAQAGSWRLPVVQRVQALSGVMLSTFDQCVFGLVTPGTCEPCQKRTTFLHNIPSVHAVFHQKRCQCEVPHHRIQGTVHGVRLSQHCQVYPPTLCQALLEAFSQELGLGPGK